VLRRLSHPKPIKTNLLPPASQYLTFLAGSTWPADEETLKSTILDLHSQNVRFIIAPHEPTPDHLADMKRLYSSVGIQIKLYSEATSKWFEETQPTVLVINQVGILADLYAGAQFAFVGNSFVRDKIHSVMEPLAAGCLTFVGPKHRNNREAISFQKETIQELNLSPVQVVKNSEDFTRIISNISRSELPKFRVALKSFIEQKTGASERLSTYVLQHYFQNR